MAGRVLLIDGMAASRIVMKARLTTACYAVTAVADAEAGLAQARDGRPDAVVLDLDLPGDAAPAFLATLRADPRLADLPVIAFAASPSAERRMAGLAAGADDVLAAPVPEALLLARLRNLLRRMAALAEFGGAEAAAALGFAERGPGFDHPGTIALVVARPEAALRTKAELQPLLRDRIAILSRAEALAEPAPGSPAPDVYVIEADIGGPGGGVRLMAELRGRSAGRHAALCLLRGTPGGPEDDAIAFDLGADDVSGPGADPREIALRLRALLRRKRADDRIRARLRDGLRLAAIDPLTGLHNRRSVMAQLAAVAAHAREARRGFAVMIADLDHFKAVNDTFGHAAGDEVLREVARRLTAGLRGGDLLGRIGGEEFLIALPGADLDEAQGVAARLCRAVQERAVRLPDGRQVWVTVSVGVAAGPAARTEPVEALIDRADRQLLSAKAAGRNQISICGAAG
jgi:two-component system cell cycle response regulator